MTKQPKALDRRKFLLTLGAGSAATAAVIGAKVAGVTPAADQTPKAGGDVSDGYKETAHIRTYYRTTLV
jgi:hypothetical protein